MQKTGKRIGARSYHDTTSPAGAADGTGQAEEQERPPDAKLQLQSVKSKQEPMEKRSSSRQSPTQLREGTRDNRDQQSTSGIGSQLVKKKGRGVVLCV